MQDAGRSGELARLAVAEAGMFRLAGYLSSLGFMVEQGTDVSKAEHNASGDGLARIPTAKEAIWVAHDPAHIHVTFFTMARHVVTILPLSIQCSRSTGRLET